MQVYKALDITENTEVSLLKHRGIPHHLLGFVDPDND